MTTALKCILHLGTAVDSTEELKAFDEETWKNVKHCENLRQTIWPKSKYNALTLPDNYQSNLCYHSSCYRSFTAVPKTLRDSYKIVSRDDNNNAVLKPTLRSEVNHPVASTSGVFDNTCLFCNQIRKKVKQKHEILSCLEQQSSAENIKRAAAELNDVVLLAKISEIDLIAKKLRYHNSCRSTYLKRSERLRVSNKENNTPSDFLLHENAYKNVRKYVEIEVIGLFRPHKLTALYKKYTSTIENPNPSYKPQNLCDRLLSDFCGDLKKCKSSNKDGLVLCPASMSDEYALRQASVDNDILAEAAQYLRNIILSLKVDNSSEYITAESLKQDLVMPEELLRFFRLLYTGSNAGKASEQTERLVKSVSDDVLYATSHGRIKPSKHVSVGLGVKSLTGSRRVIEILNRFGHSVSYHTVEEVETQLASDITEKNQATPDGLCKAPGLITSLAWDNYDENIETLSGSGTLHDTVGICYQTIPSCTDQQSGTRYETATDIVSIKQPVQVRRRSLEIVERTIEPYRKKPRMSQFEYIKQTCEIPDNLQQIHKLDMFWMMNVAVIKDIPLWSGWNAVTTVDLLPLQKIGYMENLNLPPTRLDVVVETLKQSQKVAEECGEDFVIVTYDLAVAKPALQIQAQESPLYDNVFICFGAFHILMAYFGSVGYIIEGSGGFDILTESGVLATGSLHAVVKGKHFNRCKRLHTILATAFNILHFRRFLDAKGSLPDSLLVDMTCLKENPSKNFARTEVDLTLEQTINADAASRLTGIAAFSNSESARKRWMLTRAVRSDIVGNLMEMSGLKSKDDGTKSLKPYRVKKDQEDINKVIQCIENTMNPFIQTPDANLYCITTGKQASDDVKEGLLHAFEQGKTWKDNFTANCLKNPLDFEKPIKGGKYPISLQMLSKQKSHQRIKKS